MAPLLSGQQKLARKRSLHASLPWSKRRREARHRFRRWLTRYQASLCQSYSSYLLLPLVRGLLLARSILVLRRLFHLVLFRLWVFLSSRVRVPWGLPLRPRLSSVSVKERGKVF